MCCTAKKYEAARPELMVDGMRGVDIVVTTREMAWMIKSAGIDFRQYQAGRAGPSAGLSSGAGAIFGTTGGVMEAAIRTAYELYTGETLVDIEVEAICAACKGIKEGQRDHGRQGDPRGGRPRPGQRLRAARNASARIRTGITLSRSWDVPADASAAADSRMPARNSIPLDEECLKKRPQALYDLDRNKTIRRSHDNPDIQTLYKEFLGRPLSPSRISYLHTHYHAKKPRGIVPARIQARIRRGRHDDHGNRRTG